MSILDQESERMAKLELLCHQCGLCCHNKVPLSNGTYLVHPTSTCPYLEKDNRCQIYQKRFEINPHCLTRDEMVGRDYVLPEGCPYTQLRKGYKPARVVDEEEFNKLMALELLVSLSKNPG